MTDRYAALRKAAEGATPGPWTGDRFDGTVKYNLISGKTGSGTERVVIAGDYMGDYGIRTDEDERYLMAADPTTIIALLDDRKAAAELLHANAEQLAKMSAFIDERDAVVAEKKRVDEVHDSLVDSYAALVADAQQLALEVSHLRATRNLADESVDRIKAERDALAAQVEAMKEDAERLDWLDEMNAALNSHYGTKYRWKVIMSPMITRLMTGTQRNGHVGDIDLNDANCGSASYDKCRNAIDAARKEQS